MEFFWLVGRSRSRQAEPILTEPRRLAYVAFVQTKTERKREKKRKTIAHQHRYEKSFKPKRMERKKRVDHTINEKWFVPHTLKNNQKKAAGPRDFWIDFRFFMQQNTESCWWMWWRCRVCFVLSQTSDPSPLTLPWWTGRKNKRRRKKKWMTR